MNDLDRFKFRVWDHVEKRYGLGVFEKHRLDGITAIEPPASRKKNHFTIEQSTGKTDMNGTLIFEGDVLISYDQFGNKYFFVVDYYQGNMTLMDGRGNRTLVWDGLNHAIIGNCHEFLGKISNELAKLNREKERNDG